jgi:hypothetical protein
MTAVDSERQARNLKALLGVAKALASEIKLDNLLQVIVAEAAEVMDAERATLFLYDKPRNDCGAKPHKGSRSMKFAFRSGLASPEPSQSHAE